MPYVLINSLDDDSPSPHSSPILFKDTVKNPPCNVYPIQDYYIQPIQEPSGFQTSFEILAPKPLTHKCLLPIVPSYIPINILNNNNPINRILFPTNAFASIFEFQKFTQQLRNFQEYRLLGITKILASQDVIDLINYHQYYPQNSFLLLSAKQNYNTLNVSLDYRNISDYNYLYEMSLIRLQKHVLNKCNILIEAENSKKEIDLIYLS